MPVDHYNYRRKTLRAKNYAIGGVKAEHCQHRATDVQPNTHSHRAKSHPSLTAGSFT